MENSVLGVFIELGKLYAKTALGPNPGCKLRLLVPGREAQLLGSPYPDQQTPLAWLNRAAFVANPTGTYGNLERDTVRAPGQLNFDVALSRIFQIRERLQLEARGEGFNVINHANFGNPTTSPNSSNFGRILSAAGPRILQFAMKLRF
jgi:hypothetical protein